MIRRRVSAALLVRDGFTGQPFASGSALLCRLDGHTVRPLFKPGGYLVLTDLEPGEHTLLLNARGFQQERVPLPLDDSTLLEREVNLRPGPGYAFPVDTARAQVELSDKNGPLAEENFWTALPAPVQLRLAQAVKRGTAEPVRLFRSGPAALLPVPGHFLLLDDKHPEIARIMELRDECGKPDAPFACAHPRGTRLVPALPFRTDQNGRTELCFPSAGSFSLFCRERRKDAQLLPGVNVVRWNVDDA